MGPIHETQYHCCVQELMRELQHCRKRLDLYESSSGSNSLGQGSRASSCNSLNTVEGSTVNTSSSKVSAGGQVSPGSSNSVQVSCVFYISVHCQLHTQS